MGAGLKKKSHTSPCFDMLKHGIKLRPNTFFSSPVFVLHREQVQQNSAAVVSKARHNESGKHKGQ